MFPEHFLFLRFLCKMIRFLCWFMYLFSCFVTCISASACEEIYISASFVESMLSTYTWTKNCVRQVSSLHQWNQRKKASVSELLEEWWNANKRRRKGIVYIIIWTAESYIFEHNVCNETCLQKTTELTGN